MIGKRKWTARGKFLTHDEITYSLNMSIWRLKGFTLKIYLSHQVDSHNIFILMPINSANEGFIACFFLSLLHPLFY